MELILIDGGPASGKNTLGDLLVREYQRNNVNSILLDMDTFVEAINPKWTWENDQRKEKDLYDAKKNYIKDINKYLQQGYIVIAIGCRFLTKQEISTFIDEIAEPYPIQLFHLSVPFALRSRRLNDRGPHSLIDLKKDQQDRDVVKLWFGSVYENINSPEEDSRNIMELINKKRGTLERQSFK